MAMHAEHTRMLFMHTYIPASHVGVQSRTLACKAGRWRAKQETCCCVHMGLFFFLCGKKPQTLKLTHTHTHTHRGRGHEWNTSPSIRSDRLHHPSALLLKGSERCCHGDGHTVTSPVCITIPLTWGVATDTCARSLSLPLYFQYWI